jgi:hypothetical protein
MCKCIITKGRFVLCQLKFDVNSQSKFHSGKPVAITLKNQWI